MKQYAALAVGLTALALALGYLLGGIYAGAVPPVALGAACLLGQRRAWQWTPLVCVVGFITCAAAGILLGLAPLWMLSGTVLALAAWDLLAYADQLASVQPGAAGRFARSHALDLLLVCGLGLLLGALATARSLPLGFGWAVLLGAVALLGLLRVVVVLGSNG